MIIVHQMSLWISRDIRKDEENNDIVLTEITSTEDIFDVEMKKVNILGY